MSFQKLWLAWRMLIVSTSKGLMTDRAARTAGMGGEIIWLS